MTNNLKTAANFLKHLGNHLDKHSVKTGENIVRLRRRVAFDRLLARIFNRQQSSFFLKGGYAMELRFSNARATKDMDFTYLKRAETLKEPMSELILQELQTFAQINLNDHFIYRIGLPQIDIENAPYGGSRHIVTSIIDNKLFSEFPIDVGGDFLIDDTEIITGENWLEFYDIPAPAIPIISQAQQFAEKVHAYPFPRNQINTRTKDLIDLILLLKIKNQETRTFQNALSRVFRARNTHLLPLILPKPPTSWVKPFTTMAVDCGIDESLDDSFKKVSAFYDELQRNQ